MVRNSITVLSRRIRRSPVAAFLLPGLLIASVTMTGCGKSKPGGEQTRPQLRAKSGTSRPQAPPPANVQPSPGQAQFLDPHSWYYRDAHLPPWQEEPGDADASQAPLREGMTVTTAVDSDLGDYESIKTVTSITPDEVTLDVSAQIPWKVDRPPDALLFYPEHTVRHVETQDLLHAGKYFPNFAPGWMYGPAGETFPRTTAISFSSDQLTALKRGLATKVEMGKEVAGLELCDGMTRIEPHTVPFPVLLNGQRVNLPAVHASEMKAAYTDVQRRGDGKTFTWSYPAYAICEFFILDNPQDPLVLRFQWNMEDSGAIKTFATLQVIEIDYPPATFLGGAGGGPAGRSGSSAGRQADSAGGSGGSGTPPQPPNQVFGSSGPEHGPPASGSGSANSSQGQQIEQQLAEKKPVQIYGIYFDFASATIRPQSEAVLAEIADVLRKNPAWTLTVDGHTDNIGGDAFNQKLSEQRAAAVKDALVTRYQIAANRLTTRGYGDTRPIETNSTIAGRARNRRVELARL